MQAPLALISFASGLVSWWMGGGPAWAAGALLIGAVVPFTFIAIMPTNRQLLSPARDLSSPETRLLLGKWVRLHAVRSVLGTLATLVYVGRSLC